MANIQKPSNFLTAYEAADYIGLHYNTLCEWRRDPNRRIGKDQPRYHKRGGRYYYTVKDLDDYLNGCAINSIEEAYQ